MQSEKTLRSPMNQRFNHKNKASSSRIECKPIDLQGRRVESKKLELKYKQRVIQGIQCFTCNEIGHRSSDCLDRKFANVIQCEFEEDYDEQKIVDDYCNYEVDKENSEEVVCVVKRLLYTLTQSNETQRNQILKENVLQLKIL